MSDCSGSLSGCSNRATRSTNRLHNTPSKAKNALSETKIVSTKVTDEPNKMMNLPTEVIDWQKTVIDWRREVMDWRSKMADAASKVTNSPIETPNSIKNPDSPEKPGPVDKLDSVDKPGSVENWKAFTDKFEQLAIYGKYPAFAPNYDPKYKINTPTNHTSHVLNAHKLAAEEFVHGFPTRPIRFYRNDGKLFFRLFEQRIGEKNKDGWDDDEVIYQKGFYARPTYRTADGVPRKEINYSRWKLVEGPQEGFDYDYVHRNYWAIEAHLNTYDFNQPFEEKAKLQPLTNLFGVPLSKIYPKGQQLLMKESRRGGPEWKEGQPLGADPNDTNSRTTHIGWVPPRFRFRGRGLGADPTDAVFKHWFFGDLDVPLPDKFIEPDAPWSVNPDRQVRMKSVVTDDNPVSHEFVVMSRDHLKRKHRISPEECDPEIQQVESKPKKTVGVLSEITGNKRRRIKTIPEESAELEQTANTNADFRQPHENIDPHLQVVTQSLIA